MTLTHFRSKRLIFLFINELVIASSMTYLNCCLFHLKVSGAFLSWSKGLHIPCTIQSIRVPHLEILRNLLLVKGKIFARHIFWWYFLSPLFSWALYSFQCFYIWVSLLLLLLIDFVIINLNLLQWMLALYLNIILFK